MEGKKALGEEEKSLDLSTTNAVADFENTRPERKDPPAYQNVPTSYEANVEDKDASAHLQTKRQRYVCPASSEQANRQEKNEKTRGLFLYSVPASYLGRILFSLGANVPITRTLGTSPLPSRISLESR